MSLPKKVLMSAYLLLASLLLPPAGAKPVTSSKPALNLVKINQYYVLYTNPIIPRLDKSGTFIVGAEAIALMLNARFSRNPQATVATLTKAGHSVRFTAGARTALVNGKAVALPIAAQTQPSTRQMLIPLSVLINVFHIRSAWNLKRHTLLLSGKTLMKFEPPDSFAYVYWENPGPDTHSLIPVAITTGPVPWFPSDRRLVVTVKNVSRRTIPKDFNFVNVLSAYKNVNVLVADKNRDHHSTIITYGVGGTPLPSEAAAPNPPLKPGATRKGSITISPTPYPSGYTAEVIYVAIWPVVKGHP